MESTKVAGGLQPPDKAHSLTTWKHLFNFRTPLSTQEYRTKQTPNALNRETIFTLPIPPMPTNANTFVSSSCSRCPTSLILESMTSVHAQSLCNPLCHFLHCFQWAELLNNPVFQRTYASLQIFTHLPDIHPDNLDICVEFYLHCWHQICTNCTMLEGAWGWANYVLKLQNRIHRS